VVSAVQKGAKGKDALEHVQRRTFAEDRTIELKKDAELSQIEGCPRHVAIIMDGNGRWATQRGRPRLFGHHAGARRVREIVEACPQIGVEYLTIFAFSTENWKRTQAEVAGLMSLFKRYIRRETRALTANGVRVRFIGDRTRLEKKLIQMMGELETATAGNTRVHLTIAINYGGRDEVARATRRLAHDVASGKLKPEEVDVETLPKYLDTHVLPDPDLVIRTSGEARISNFLLWQSAYAEYEFIDTLWPEFKREEFEKLCAGFGGRDRRFGGVKA
jgi:undecaprenyl diphosphate synthase